MGTVHEFPRAAEFSDDPTSVSTPRFFEGTPFAEPAAVPSARHKGGDSMIDVLVIASYGTPNIPSVTAWLRFPEQPQPAKAIQLTDDICGLVSVYRGQPADTTGVAYVRVTPQQYLKLSQQGWKFL